MEDKAKSEEIFQRVRVSRTLNDATQNLGGVAKDMVDKANQRIREPISKTLQQLADIEPLNVTKLQDLKELDPKELEKVSGLFAVLTLSVSSRAPAVVGETPKAELSQLEKDITDQLKDIPPEIMVEAIFQNPPTVLAYEPAKYDRINAKGPIVRLNPQQFRTEVPSDNDLNYVKRDIPTPANTNEALFQNGITAIKRHLEAPTVKDDGFTDHRNQRAPWEKGVNNALSAIDETADEGKSKSDYGNLGKYATAFANRLNFNRLAGTRGRVRSVGLESIQASLPNSSELKDKVLKLEKKYDERAKVLAKGHVSVHAHEVTNLAKETLDLLSTKP